jgi:hypothetical protein
MKHKRVLFGLLAAVAAMMFLFCGDSVVTTGTGSEVPPGTTPGTEGGEKSYAENVFIVAKTNKGFSVTNPEKLKKAAADVATVDLALKLVRTNAVGKESIWIQFGKGGSDVLDLGTQKAVFGAEWSGVVSNKIVLEGSLKGTLDVSESPISILVDVAGPVTVLVINKNGVNNSNVSYGEFVDPDNVVKKPDPTYPPTFEGAYPYVTANYLESGDVELLFKTDRAVKSWISTSASYSQPTQKTVKDLGKKAGKGATSASFKDTISLKTSDTYIWVLIEDAKDTTLFDFASVAKATIHDPADDEVEISGIQAVRRGGGTVDIYVWASAHSLTGSYLLLPTSTTTDPSALEILRHADAVPLSGSVVGNVSLDPISDNPTFTFSLPMQDSKNFYFVAYKDGDIEKISEVEKIVLTGDATAPTLSAASADFVYPVASPAVAKISLKSTKLGVGYFVAGVTTDAAPAKEDVVSDHDGLFTISPIFPEPSGTNPKFEASNVQISGGALATTTTKLFVVVVDTAGNVSAVTTVAIALDDQPPTVSNAAFVRNAGDGTSSRFDFSINKGATIYYKIDAMGLAALTKTDLTSFEHVTSSSTTFDVTTMSTALSIYYIAVGDNGIDDGTVLEEALSAYDSDGPTFADVSLVSRTADIAVISIDSDESGDLYYFVDESMRANEPTGETDWELLISPTDPTNPATPPLGGQGAVVAGTAVTKSVPLPLAAITAAGGAAVIYVAVVDTNGNVGYFGTVGSSGVTVTQTPSATITFSKYLDGNDSEVDNTGDMDDITQIELSGVAAFTGNLYYGFGEAATGAPPTLATSPVVVTDAAVTVAIPATRAAFTKYIWYALETGDGTTTPLIRSAPVAITTALAAP